MSGFSFDRLASRGRWVEALESRRLFSVQLAGSFVAVPQGGLATVGKNHLAIQIENQGTSRLKGPVSVTIYASADAALDGGDTPLTTFAKPASLRAGQGKRVAFSFATPADAPQGNDYLLAKLSAGAANSGTVFSSAQPVSIQQPFTDLVTEFVYLPGKSILTNGVVANQPWAAVRVVNIGNTPVSGKVDLALYLSAQSVLDSSAARAAHFPGARLKVAPGGSKLFAARIDLPPGSLPGAYTLFGVASPSATIHVRHPADLVAAAAVPVTVVGLVPTSVLLGNYHRHHHHDCVYYDGDDYAADAAAAAVGLDDVVVAGDAVPPGFVPAGAPGTEPSTQPAGVPSSQPASQPSDEDWDSGLPAAAVDVAAQQSAGGNGNTDNPSDGWGGNYTGDGSDDSSDSSDGGDDSSGDDGGDDGGGDDGGGGDDD